MQLFPLILFGIATAFSPGPNNIMTSYTAFNFGFKKAIPTMLGVIIGWTLLIILLQLTSAAVFEKYQFIQTTIKILGSVYLLYMAYKLSFGGKTSDNKIDPKPVTFLNTFWFQFVNPKAWSIAITVASGFFPTEENIFIGVTFVTVTAAIICFPTISLWALFGSGLRKFINDEKTKKIVEYLLALLLVLTGLFILLK